MDFLSQINSEFSAQVLIPILIFFARVADVSMGTIRIIFVSRGIRLLSSVIAFFEILIWLVAITQIMSNLTNVINYIAYAAGFAAGNFLGITIEKFISLGTSMIRIVTGKEATELVNYLKSKGYGVTSVDARGSFGAVKIIFTVVKRKNINSILKTIKKFNPNSFYTIEDIRFVSESGHPLAINKKRNLFHRLLKK